MRATAGIHDCLDVRGRGAMNGLDSVDRAWQRGGQPWALAWAMERTEGLSTETETTGKKQRGRRDLGHGQGQRRVGRWMSR